MAEFECKLKKYRQLKDLTSVFYYCCNLMVSTIAILLICLIGRLIAIPADARHVKTMIKSESTGIVHPVPHFSAIKN